SKAIAESLQAIAEARAKAFKASAEASVSRAKASKASAEAENARDQVYEALAKVDAGISNEGEFANHFCICTFLDLNLRI
ncbi:hypothetical protein A2U01_0082242, partial [Trifolium medium]|nr:hypothetical protein [Trifolium medium]